MKTNERRILGILAVLAFVMVLAIGVTWYVTRIVPLDNMARTQVYYDATERARD